MSTILEALKKSEAERREGGPPPPAAHPLRRGGTKVPWLAGGVALGAAAAAIFFGLWARGPTPAAADAESVATATPAATEVSATANPGANEEPAMPTPAGAEPAAVVRAEAASERPAPPAARTRIAEAPPPRPVPVDVPPPVRTAPTSTTPVEPVADRTTPAAAAPRSETPALAAAEPAPEVEEQLPRYNQLPGLRSQVGDLNLTMLVYSNEPQRRLALINGERLREGDTVNQLTVVAIRRDGCVLQAGARRFLLPSQQ
ncbi:MAG: general secretion pathway protein GspB [Pseudomonadota bacterium]